MPSVAKLDTLVTVVDAQTFPQRVKDEETLAQMKMGNDPNDNRGIGGLLADQVEVCNVLLLNKKDLAKPEEMTAAKGLVQFLNPTARIMESEKSNVPIASVVGTGMYRPRGILSHPAWIAEQDAGHTPETEEFGIRSFIFRSAGRDARPFDSTRFKSVIDQTLPTDHWQYKEGPMNGCILRAKGWAWLNDNPTLRFEFHVAGGDPQVGCGNSQWRIQELLSASDDLGKKWKDAVGSKQDDVASQCISDMIPLASEDLQKEIRKLQERGAWHPVHGDRRQEIVVIGDSKKMDVDAIRAALTAALLTDTEVADAKASWC